MDDYILDGHLECEVLQCELANFNNNLLFLQFFDLPDLHKFVQEFALTI